MYEIFGEHADIIRKIVQDAPFESIKHTGMDTGVPISASGRRAFICRRCGWWGTVKRVSVEVKTCPMCAYTVQQVDLLQFLNDNAYQSDVLVNHVDGALFWKSVEWKQFKREWEQRAEEEATEASKQQGKKSKRNKRRQ